MYSELGDFQVSQPQSSRLLASGQLKKGDTVPIEEADTGAVNKQETVGVEVGAPILVIYIVRRITQLLSCA